VEERFPGADGVTYREGESVRILVRDDLSPAATVHTLLHEAAHTRPCTFRPIAPSRGKSVSSRLTRTACAVAAALGYDHTPSTYRYLTSWNATPEGLARALPRIGRAVRAILAALGFQEGVEDAA
jgi:hypothetical protein